MKKSIIICLLLVSGCTQRIAHIENGEIIIDNPVYRHDRSVWLHEYGHKKGLIHCKNKACYMYPVYHGGTDLCTKCQARLRTTTENWLFWNIK
jgi:predicted Zn-dependent protease